MSSIKNGLISLYCHFNKIIKRPGTSFQSPALRQKYIRNICHTTHQYLTKFYFDSIQDSRELSIILTFFIYVAMPVMTSQILRSVDFTKTQKSRYLKNETLSFLQIKNSLITHQRLLYCKKQFCSESDSYFWYYRSLLYQGIFFKKMGKNKNKLRTIYHLTGSCQEKSVNFQELFIHPYFGKFWNFFPCLF